MAPSITQFEVKVAVRYLTGTTEDFYVTPKDAARIEAAFKDGDDVVEFCTEDWRHHTLRVEMLAGVSVPAPPASWQMLIALNTIDAFYNLRIYDGAQDVQPTMNTDPATHGQFGLTVQATGLADRPPAWMRLLDLQLQELQVKTQTSSTQ